MLIRFSFTETVIFDSGIPTRFSFSRLLFRYSIFASTLGMGLIKASYGELLEPISNANVLL